MSDVMCHRPDHTGIRQLYNRLLTHEVGHIHPSQKSACRTFDIALYAAQLTGEEQIIPLDMLIGGAQNLRCTQIGIAVHDTIAHNGNIL